MALISMTYKLLISFAPASTQSLVSLFIFPRITVGSACLLWKTRVLRSFQISYEAKRVTDATSFRLDINANQSWIDLFSQVGGGGVGEM
jgi:hypothetical protein